MKTTKKKGRPKKSTVTKAPTSTKAPVKASAKDKLEPIGKVEKQGGNGHSPQELDSKLQSFLGHGSFDGIFMSHEGASAIKMFLERGKEVPDFILRGRFPDDIFMKAAMRHLAKCREFQDKDAEDELLNVLAGYPAIGGNRIQEFLEAVIGQHRTDQRKNGWQRFRDRLGLGSNNDQQ